MRIIGVKSADFTVDMLQSTMNRLLVSAVVKWVTVSEACCSKKKKNAFASALFQIDSLQSIAIRILA